MTIAIGHHLNGMHSDLLMRRACSFTEKLQWSPLTSEASTPILAEDGLRTLQCSGLAGRSASICGASPNHPNFANHTRS